ncbi:FecR family protein [Chitinophaga pinensis]|uniref:Anti-FecI sigma factor, FecR n=1 Tax=Chitinophaga pinensis (strain ATCC 43595 / DSM 2588 / LMG 13176 / NBRC 15968 / NCIMB 11800 / UQM 2034) TaxID=485918 RepID=A0A979GYF6_CHIPD|nr:FecR family protein [Chitinophaga pinensis]ACU61940.1 anti-FecI sigma factor, FecR [Chitinophaga pinensis DSM 2588]
MEDVFHEEELRGLFDKFLQKACTETEVRKLATYAADQQFARIWQEMIEQVDVEGTAEELYSRHQQPIDKVFNKLSFLAEEQPETQTSLRIHPLRRYWWAAAAIVLLAASGTWVLVQRKPAQQIAAIYDKAPGTDKAVLTLADGSVVSLDSMGKQQLVQGNSTVQQQGGTLQYKADARAAGTSFNTLTTPRGGQFRVVLPDGTAVWLNAATSLRYPTAFNGNERVVTLRGEAYFEVAKDPQQPFRVQVDDRATVEVLGTNFNIHAYSDESPISTTLLDGKVVMKTGDDPDRRVVLNPLQQAVADNGKVVLNRTVNIDQVMAWKNGMFNFDGLDLRQVLQQIARWYDVEIVFEGKIPTRKFGGEIQRDLSLQQVLRILEKMDVKCRIGNGNKLIVM